MTSPPARPWDDDRLSAYVDDALSADERAEVERHWADSPEWQKAVEELRTLRRRVQSLPKHAAPQQVLGGVLHALQGQSQVPTAASPSASTHPDDRPAKSIRQHQQQNSMGKLLLPFAALAASLLLLLAIWRPWSGERELAQRKLTPSSEQAHGGRLVSPTSNEEQSKKSDDSNLAPGDQPRESIAGRVEDVEPQVEPESSIPSSMAASGEALGSPVAREATPATVCEVAIVAQPRSADHAERIRQVLLPGEPVAETSESRSAGRRREFIADPSLELYLVTASSPTSMDDFLAQVAEAAHDVQTAELTEDQQIACASVMEQIPSEEKGTVQADKSRRYNLEDGVASVQRQQWRTQTGNVQVTPLGRIPLDANAPVSVSQQAFADSLRSLPRQVMVQRRDQAASPPAFESQARQHLLRTRDSLGKERQREPAAMMDSREREAPQQGPPPDSDGTTCSVLVVIATGADGT